MWEPKKSQLEEEGVYLSLPLLVEGRELSMGGVNYLSGKPTLEKTIQVIKLRYNLWLSEIEPAEASKPNKSQKKSLSNNSSNL